MGKKKCKKNIEEIITTWKYVPFVSVCTPTFNRRPFIESMISCFNHQTYPKDKMEWIIIDDGTDKIEELVNQHPNIKYFYCEDKMTLGKKRNLLHKKSKGEIIVYMDDDDYYPPCRVQHAVYMLLMHPDALCSGSSKLHIYFKDVKKIYEFGPYGEKHATAGTFAFKRKLLDITEYEETASLAEEKYFLKNYTIPFVQLDPIKTILVFSHDHNTFDKRTLLHNANPKYVKITNLSVDLFIKETELIKFFTEDIDSKLLNYTCGQPHMKPDVLNQIEEMKKKREPCITIQQGNNPPKTLSINEVVHLLSKQSEIIERQSKIIEGKESELKMLKDMLSYKNNC
jgi:glycosyltransferase involved in cell wall biosynthesis